MSFQDFTDAYLEAMFWAEVFYDEKGEEMGPADDYADSYDLSDRARREIDEDCVAFYSANSVLWASSHASDAQAGHDFYLTRNGHGAGFWARPELYGSENAKHLTEAAEVYGTQGLDWCGEDRPVEVHN